jgi:Putative transposase
MKVGGAVGVMGTLGACRVGDRICPAAEGTSIGAWRDGTTHLVMSPLEFMQRLAALVPRPRLHLIRFHGVLAPYAKLRALVVPQEPETPAQSVAPAECEANCAHHRAVRLSGARLLKRVFELD